jgi:hypothetical protein
MTLVLDSNAYTVTKDLSEKNLYNPPSRGLKKPGPLGQDVYDLARIGLLN